MRESARHSCLRVKLAAVMLIAGLNLAIAWDARRTYESFSALNFPGAGNVRVEPDKAAVLRAIVSRINYVVRHTGHRARAIQLSSVDR